MGEGVVLSTVGYAERLQKGCLFEARSRSTLKDR